MVWYLRLLYSFTLVHRHPEPPRLRLFLITTLFLLLFCAVFWFFGGNYGFSLALENLSMYHIEHKFLTREHFGWLDKRCHRLDFSSQRVSLKTLDIVRYFIGLVQYFDQNKRDFLECRDELNILCKVSILCSFCDVWFQCGWQ